VQQADTQSELVWGARNIASAINRSTSATFHLLESNQLPGASKVGGKWCFAPSVFYADLSARQIRALRKGNRKS
jgi:hypothetical protein